MKSISLVRVALTLLNLISVSFAADDAFFPGDLVTLDRRSTCAVPGYTLCPQADVPINFCCPSDHVCLSLAASVTILCCPNGSDCSDQSPISCDIQQQNATAHPESLIKTTNLLSDMFNCGSGCCPFGFNCSTSGNCSMFAEQKQIVDAELSTLSSTVSSTSAASSTPTSSTFSTSLPSTSETANTGSVPARTDAAINDHHSISFSAGVLAGGIIALVFVIASVAGVLFWFINRKRKSKTHPKVEVESTQESRPKGSPRSSFRKAELDPASSCTEMDASSERRELDGSSFSRKSKFSVREMEGDAAHEVSGESQIHEMDAGPLKGRFSWL